MTRQFVQTIASIVLATSTLADSTDPPASTDQVIEEIVVTGSHLRRGTSDGPAPIAIFDREYLARTGVNTLADFARYLPYNSGALNDEATASTNAPGTAFFNLRGLGAQTTLTLVNGRRVAAYGASQSQGHTFVDVNSIPTTAIERIEVLKTGASAIYGSDAIAGVINIVLKQDYDGLALGAGYLSTTRADAAETFLDITWGQQWTRTRLVGSASALRRDAMRATNRPYLADSDLTNIGGFNLRSDISAPMTVFRREIGRVQAEPACPPAGSNHPVAFTLPTPQPHPILDSRCMYNTKRFIHSIPDTRRLGFTGHLRHQLDATSELLVEAIVNHNDTWTQLPPGTTDKTPLDGFFFPLVMATHPGNPFGESVEINYRTADVGPIGRNTDALSWRLASILNGSIKEWQWTGAALWGVSDVDSKIFNLVDAAAFQRALLGMGGPGQDQYYNPFGLAPDNPPEVIAGIKIPVSLRHEQSRERAIDLTATRKLGRLRGGPAGLAVGYQFRDQRTIRDGDAFQTSGTALGADLLRPIDASRQIHSFYTELALPLLGGIEVQVAARHERYSDFGVTTNPTLAIRWRPKDSFSLHGSVGTSFRAPTFVELLEPKRRNQQFLQDRVRCPLTGAPLDCAPSPYDVERGGNDTLRPEEGRSWIYGFEWLPPRLTDLELTIDFWRFDHRDRILELDPQFVIDEFGTDTAFVKRRATLPMDPPGTPGPIELIRATKINAEQLETKGIDVLVRYLFSMRQFGELSAEAALTYLDEFVFRQSTHDELLDRNLAGGAELFALPRLRGNLLATWANGNHRLTATMHFIGGYRSPVNRVVDRRETDMRFDIDEHVTVDMQYEKSFETLQNSALRIGCQNCLDREPPIYNYTASGEHFHDPRGAIVYVRWLQRL